MKSLHQLSICEGKMLLLTGIIGKAYKVRNLFNDEIPAICSILEPGARPNSCMLITFDWLLFMHENSN